MAFCFILSLAFNNTRLKKAFYFLVLLMVGQSIQAQNAISIATDASILRSFSEGQKFWSFGQTVQGFFHMQPRGSFYAQVGYYTNGKSKNPLQATAKDIGTAPQRLDYTAYSSVRLRHISLGWQHYFVGAYNNEESWNLYGTVGFGLLAGRAENRYDQTIDTALYNVPQKAIAGSEHFKRLTLDVSLGAEIMLGAGIYLYTDVRTWIPASDYPSPYLYNNNLPRTGMVNGGIRVLLE